MKFKKKNYIGWNVQINQFPHYSNIEKQLEHLIRFAILAPSSHNSQPWLFKIKQNTIYVYANTKKALPESDTNNRQLILSLGSAIENILIASDYYQLKSKIQYFPGGFDKSLIAKISFQNENTYSNKPQNHLIFSIPKRFSNRKNYAKDLPPKTFIDEILNLSQSQMQILIINEEFEKNKIADIVLNATHDAMEQKSFREELSHYIKNNLTHSFTGMPGFTIGLPTPLSFIAPKLVKAVNIDKPNRKNNEELLKKHTSLFTIICTKNDHKQDWVLAGQMYQRIALLCKQNGLDTSVMAAPIQIGNHYQKLQKQLQTFYRPQFFFRMGYPEYPTPLHSPRTKINDVLI